MQPNVLLCTAPPMKDILLLLARQLCPCGCSYTSDYSRVPTILGQQQFCPIKMKPKMHVHACMVGQPSLTLCTCVLVETFIARRTPNMNMINICNMKNVEEFGTVPISLLFRLCMTRMSQHSHDYMTCTCAFPL